MAVGFWQMVGGGVLVVVLMVLLLGVIYLIGRPLLKLIFGVITNSILGLIAIFAVDFLFNLGIPLRLYTLIPTALFGLAGVGTLIILRLFGIPL
jgi:hypothetical protein